MIMYVILVFYIFMTKLFIVMGAGGMGVVDAGQGRGDPRSPSSNVSLYEPSPQNKGCYPPLFFFAGSSQTW
jgi:hypothetical protein